MCSLTVSLQLFTSYSDLTGFTVSLTYMGLSPYWSNHILPIPLRTDSLRRDSHIYDLGGFHKLVECPIIIIENRWHTHQRGSINHFTRSVPGTALRDWSQLKGEQLPLPHSLQYWIGKVSQGKHRLLASEYCTVLWNVFWSTYVCTFYNVWNRL